MKRALGISIVMLCLAVALMIWFSESPAMADVPQQRLATPTSTPFRPPVSPQTSSFSSTVVGLTWQGAPLPKGRTFAKSYPVPPPNPGDLVDNWELLVRDDFEQTVPITSSCFITEGNFFGPPQGRFWGPDTSKFYSGAKSIWPARGGPNGLDPSVSGTNYPPGLDSWLICGPYDFTYGQYAEVNFKFWRQFTDPSDFVGFVYRSTLSTWDAVIYPGSTISQSMWLTQTLSFPTPGGQPVAGQPQVWIAVVFRSNPDGNVGKGVWVDDLKIWQHYTPTVTCGDLDPGNKGLHLPSHEYFSDTILMRDVAFPIIRKGDTQALTGTIAANAKWVRLGFKPPDPVSEYSQEQEYDRMVDSLCMGGISVLGMVNDETLTRNPSDANNNLTAESYRNELADAAARLAAHFKGRIKYWQVWNEPYISSPLTLSHYAALLTTVSQAIKNANPDAKVVSAGLEHAWNDFNIYQSQVYSFLNTEQGGARPFDTFAVHPYFQDSLTYGGLDPRAYLHASDQMSATLGDRTIVDKFVRTMEANGDAGKKVWATEIGWNSAYGQSDVGCLANKVTDEFHQALYLKSGLDILFNEARSLDKVFWYQYQDIRADACGTNRPNNIAGQIGKPSRDVVKVYQPNANEPGYWGLYRADKHTPKLSLCAFTAYPQTCQQIHSVFLPLILNEQ